MGGLEPKWLRIYVKVQIMEDENQSGKMLARGGPQTPYMKQKVSFWGEMLVLSLCETKGKGHQEALAIYMPIHHKSSASGVGNTFHHVGCQWYLPAWEQPQTQCMEACLDIFLVVCVKTCVKALREHLCGNLCGNKNRRER